MNPDLERPVRRRPWLLIVGLVLVVGSLYGLYNQEHRPPPTKVYCEAQTECP